MKDLADVTVAHEEEIPIAHVRGQVDLSNAEEVRATLEAAVTARSPGLIVDLSDVSYLDSAGVRLLFLLEGHLGALGKRLRAVVPASAPIMRVLVLADVGRVVPLDATLDEAMAEMRVLA